MKPIEINNTSDQVVLFLRKKHELYDANSLAYALQISPQTLSRRIYTNQWKLEEIRALKRIFAKCGFELVGEVKSKVSINLNK
jgi:transcriptional antiterminator